MQRRQLLAGGAALALAPVRGAFAQADTLRVAVAADMRFAMEQIGKQFTQLTQVPVVVTSGASGTLVRQIAQGAPFHLFLSADEASVLQLAQQGLSFGGLSDTGQVYALGYLALVWPKQAPVGLNVQQRLLAARKVAIANPEHAPYGRAAVAVMHALGVHAQLQTKLALGENVTQAAQFVATGAADVGLVALSIAVAPAVKQSLAHELQNPQGLGVLTQRMLLLKGAQDAKVRTSAQRLFAYLLSEPARAVLRQNGFSMPQQSA